MSGMATASFWPIFSEVPIRCISPRACNWLASTSADGGRFQPHLRAKAVLLDATAIIMTVRMIFDCQTMYHTEANRECALHCPWNVCQIQRERPADCPEQAMAHKFELRHVSPQKMPQCSGHSSFDQGAWVRVSTLHM